MPVNFQGITQISNQLQDWALRRRLMAQTGGPFDPEYFDPAEVVFSDPKERLKESME